MRVKLTTTPLLPPLPPPHHPYLKFLFASRLLFSILHVTITNSLPHDKGAISPNPDVSPSVHGDGNPLLEIIFAARDIQIITSDSQVPEDKAIAGRDGCGEEGGVRTEERCVGRGWKRREARWEVDLKG